MSEQRTMWERLARVLFERYGDARDFSYQTDPRPWDEAVDAILAELREPDAVMVDAGDRAFVAHQMAAGGQAHRAAFGAGYRAAIDAIREGEG